MSYDAAMGLFAIGLFVIIIVIRVGVRKAANKASDAVRNKWVDHKETKEPPQRMNLADRYGVQSQAANTSQSGRTTPAASQPASPKVCPQCGKELRTGAQFCPSCGTKIGN